MELSQSRNRGPFIQACIEMLNTHEGIKKGQLNSPYSYHPLAVAALVLKYGGDEAQATVALLHDVPTHHPDLKTRTPEQLFSHIQDTWGADVAAGVGAFVLSQQEFESTEEAVVWRRSHEVYLKQVVDAHPRALLVMACEELHELNELVLDFRHGGAQVFERFPVYGAEVFWYFRELLQIFYRRRSELPSEALVTDFAAWLQELKEATHSSLAQQ